MKKKVKTKSLPPPPTIVDSGEEEEDVEQQDAIEEKDSDSIVAEQDNDIDDNDDDDDDDEMDLGNFKASGGSTTTVAKKRKKGIIYISNIPKHMNVTRMREILNDFGKVGRIYLQPEKQPAGKSTKKKRKKYNIHFTEGWVEFESKRIAKQIVPLLNNKQISTRKKSQFYDSLWSMKYLPRFKWVHLTERMNYEQAVHKQRLQTEVSQARKETTFFQNNLDKSEHLKKLAKKGKKVEA
ncbi:hypothetical protein KR044_001226 [Drosophila immigrans]|nr:hypothetical protein KR044_001226 [Drosophila immigrans]